MLSHVLADHVCMYSITYTHIAKTILFKHGEEFIFTYDSIKHFFSRDIHYNIDKDLYYIKIYIYNCKYQFFVNFIFGILQNCISHPSYIF